MKPASPTLAALINGGAFYDCTLYAFTTGSGLVVRLTTADFDVWDTSGNRYHCGALGSGFPRIDSERSRSRGNWKRGLDADSWSVTIMPTVQDPVTGLYTYPDMAGGTPWLAACRAGIFDSANVTILRAYFAQGSLAPPFTQANSTAVGTIVLFNGLVDTVDCNAVESVFQINDYKALFSIRLPRNLYQASCRHLLFDSGCTLSAAAYARTATALAGSSQSVVLASPPAAPGSGTWQLGRMQFTSGANASFQRTIAAWNGVGVFTLQSPFPFPVATGDALTIWPGCDKQYATCGAFGNQLNFGGEPFIPVPEVSLGG